MRQDTEEEKQSKTGIEEHFISTPLQALFDSSTKETHSLLSRNTKECPIKKHQKKHTVSYQETPKETHSVLSKTPKETHSVLSRNTKGNTQCAIKKNTQCPIKKHQRKHTVSYQETPKETHSVLSRNTKGNTQCPIKKHQVNE
ncbi:hypothetical protein CEXT_689941 [Caerostris extrusa]|uniref:Uncharacterized protein n=1 Tax=Caerostris extrusa TaxID=172846 RepID=A0AAV4T707_CAEEX|nr:hypothetical protein CEXT_689941 [Caerostris extrusa]